MTPTREPNPHTAELLFPEVREILRVYPEDLAEAVEDCHPADLADMVARLDAEEVPVFFGALPVDRAADVAEHVENTVRARLVTALDPDRAARIVGAMMPDDRADVLADLDPEPAAAILARIALPQRREAQILLQYQEHTAGGLMTPLFVTLPQATRADHALALVRAAAQDRETIYNIYVIDGGGRLAGVVSLRELLAADPMARLSDIMITQVVTAAPDLDQEETARLIARYDLLALPVVDADNRMLGIVTVDDIIDVLVEEGTEDAQKMGAVQPIDEPYLTIGFWNLMRKRVVWLIVLFFGELLTASALQHYEGVLTEMIALVVFIPLIISTGGNSGSQTATLVIRALATGEIRLRQFLSVILRELGMGLVLGATLGAVGLLRVLVWGGNPVSLALVVGLTISAVVVSGCVVGAAFPLLLKRLGLDPALMSAPFIASLVDVTGVVLYFTIARALLGL